MKYLFKALLLITLCCTVCALTGCGGGGSSIAPGPTLTNFNLDIEWAARSRAPIAGPASALSATITLAGALPDGNNFTLTVNRNANPAAYTGHYTTAPQQVRTGAWALTVTFYALANGNGNVVGIAQDIITVASGGTEIGTIVTNGTVDTVVVDAGQTLMVGEQKELVSSAYTADHDLLALTPGSTTWKITSGADVLTLTNDGTANGIAAGTAQVAATVDGKTSNATAVVILASPAAPSGFTYDKPQTKTVNVTANGEIADTTTGLMFNFPNGGSGALTTARGTTIPNAPATGGTAFYLHFTGTATIALKTPVQPNTDTYLFIYGPAHGDLDGGIARDQRWNAIMPRATSGGYSYFDIPLSAARARQGGRSTGGGVDGYTVTLPRGTADIALRQTAEGAITAGLNAMTSSQRATVQARINARPVQYAFVSPSGSCSYEGFAWGFFAGTTAAPVLTLRTDAPDNVVVHEVGHYLTHMAMGDPEYYQVQQTSPDADHAIGTVHTGRTTISEDYAYYMQFLCTGHVDNGNPKYIRSMTGTAKPDTTDFPAIEGFATALLAYLTHDNPNNIPDFATLKLSTPAIGATPGEVLQLYQYGCTDVNDLLSRMRTFVSDRLHDGAMTVIAERCGWSYHARGRLIYQGGAPVANAKVENICVVKGTEYSTPGYVMTDEKGEFLLPRVFPGPSKLRITPDGGPAFVESIDINERGSTTQQVVLPDIQCGTSPRLSALHQSNYVTIDVTGYYPAHSGDETITVYGGYTSATWNGRNFVMTLNATTVDGEGNTMTTKGTITGEVNASGTEVIQANGNYEETLNGVAGNTKHEVYTIKVKNVPVSATDGLIFDATGSAAANSVVEATASVSGTAGSSFLSADNFSPIKTVRVWFKDIPK